MTANSAGRAGPDPYRHSRVNGRYQRPELRQVSVVGYKDLMSAFPTGVAVVTAMDADGNPRGMTCSSVASVTLEPPTLLVCLGLGSITLEAAHSCGQFAVNLLHARARHAAEVFSSHVPDRFTQVRWRRLSSGLPWLAYDAFALAECRITGSVEVGDHAVVLGQVIVISQIPDSPLLYGGRRFLSWGEMSCAAGEENQAAGRPSSVGQIVGG